MRRNEQDWKWNGPEIPPIKPYYYAFTVASDGGIWVAREGVGIHVGDCDENPHPDTVSITRGRCWRSEVHIDAFDADGRFLGEIAEPNFGSTRFYRVHGRTVVTWGLNPDGIPMVKRYRLVLPGGERP